MTTLRSPPHAPNGIYTRVGAQYKVYGAIQNIPRPHSHIRHTCQHVNFFQPNVRGEATSAISEATPLLSTATPSRLRHSPGPIVLHTQQPSFEPCRSASVVARTARCPTASKPAQQPVRGVSRILPLGSAKVTNDGARDHSMDQTDDTHHTSALKPQPRAAIHLHPP